jgi:hypothetical protein
MITIFWDVPPCSIPKIDLPFRSVYCLPNQGERPGDRGNKHF